MVFKSHPTETYRVFGVILRMVCKMRLQSQVLSQNRLCSCARQSHGASPQRTSQAGAHCMTVSWNVTVKSRVLTTAGHCNPSLHTQAVSLGKGPHPAISCPSLCLCPVNPFRRPGHTASETEPQLAQAGAHSLYLRPSGPCGEKPGEPSGDSQRPLQTLERGHQGSCSHICAQMSKLLVMES